MLEWIDPVQLEGCSRMKKCNKFYYNIVDRITNNQKDFQQKKIDPDNATTKLPVS